MNLKSIVIAGMIMGNSLHARELKQIPILEKNDFSDAREITKMGKSVLSIDLTPSGILKLQTMNPKGLGDKIRLKIGKNIFRFKLKEQVAGEQVIIGPFSHSEAIKIKREINQ